MIARRFLVSGRVQGVGFRWFVAREAESRGLAGWTRNLPDGRVEVLAQGEPDVVRELAGTLARGPSAARVERVHESEAAVDPDLTGFDVAF